MSQPRVVLIRPKRSYGAGLSTTSKNKESHGRIPQGETPQRGGISPGDVPVKEEKQNKNFNEAVALASNLSAEQRRDLVAQLSLDLQINGADQSRDIDMWATAIHEALQDALGGSLGSVVGPLAVKRIVGSRSAFEPLAEFMQHSRLGEAQVRERLSLYRLLADLVVAYAKKIAKHTGAPLSLKLVANCSRNVAGLFDSAFPGYLAAGLAHVVARRFSQATKN